MKIDLSKAYNFNGKEYTFLNLNVEEMTGKDLLQCEREFKARSKDTGAIKELEDSWALTVAAKAAGMKYGDFLPLSAVDYLKVVGQIKLFLNKGWESKKEEREEISTEEGTV